VSARCRSKVLIVDDRPENLLATESILESLGCVLIRASSGEEALKRLLAEDFAVVLLDVHMPGMDGFETAEYMKRVEHTRHVPIIFLTAISKHPSSAFRGYESGAVDYLSKPFDPDVLRSKVGVFIELYEQRAAVEALVAQQTALRRVATAIATNEERGRVFAMVAEEVGRLLDVEAAVVAQADDDDRLLVVGAWARRGSTAPALETPLTDAVIAEVVRTGLPARSRAETREEGRSEERIVAPIHVGARLWGLVAATAAAGEGVLRDGEKQLAEFADRRRRGPGRGGARA
jgi:CheY-like chemotaxis protein